MTRWIIVVVMVIFTGSCDTDARQVDNSESAVTSTHSTDHLILGEETAKEQLKEALEGKGQRYTFDTLIKKASTAIAIVEPILFELYGKQQIISERPYEVYLLDGYWYLSGTIPKDWKGGGFEIILSARNGEIIRLTHYK
jgi:hypothetical protein